jgi:hypothetical protein
MVFMAECPGLERRKLDVIVCVGRCDDYCGRSGTFKKDAFKGCQAWQIQVFNDLNNCSSIIPL